MNSPSEIQINQELANEIIYLIEEKNKEELISWLDKLYAQDIAEIFEYLNLEQAVYWMSFAETSKKVNVLSELEDDTKLRFLQGYSDDEIANDFLLNMDSDDAVDLLGLMDAEYSNRLIPEIKDREYSSALVRMLKYPDDSAGGLMARELVSVNIDWDINQCIEEIRKQAEEVETVLTVYVTDHQNKLLGRVGLKKLILATRASKVVDVYNDNVIFANLYDRGEEIARLMQKYDLVALPIVDALHRLVGRVTIDDVVDFIKEEAEKDYQMLSGISKNVEDDKKVWLLSKARLPWLLVGLAGGVANSLLIRGFEGQLTQNVQLAFFMPLVMAMGGNAGVQSSSIVVQGIANNTISSPRIFSRIGREFLVGLFNGLVCSTILLMYNLIVQQNAGITAVVSIALSVSILLATVMGALIPLVLHRFKIDPALATGPFITTSNDLVGLLIYFYVGMELLGKF